MPNKDSVTYLQGFNAGITSSRGAVLELEKQIVGLKRLVNCKHMRVSSIRLSDGYSCACLTCGETWVKKDKPLTEEEMASKLIFDNWEGHNKWRESKGLKPINAE